MAKFEARKRFHPKAFDHATSCSTENALAIQEGIYERMIQELEAVGVYLCNAWRRPSSRRPCGTRRAS